MFWKPLDVPKENWAKFYQLVNWLIRILFAFALITTRFSKNSNAFEMFAKWNTFFKAFISIIIHPFHPLKSDRRLVSIHFIYWSKHRAAISSMTRKKWAISWNHLCHEVTFKMVLWPVRRAKFIKFGSFVSLFQRPTWMKNIFLNTIFQCRCRISMK